MDRCSAQSANASRMQRSFTSALAQYKVHSMNAKHAAACVWQSCISKAKLLIGSHQLKAKCAATARQRNLLAPSTEMLVAKTACSHIVSSADMRINVITCNRASQEYMTCSDCNLLLDLV